MDNNVKVDLAKCDDIECVCGNRLFVQAFTLKRVPGLMIAQTKDKIVNVSQMVCTGCSTIYDPTKGAEPIKEKKKIEIVN